MPKTPGKMHMYDMVKIDTIVFEIVAPPPDSPDLIGLIKYFFPHGVPLFIGKKSPTHNNTAPELNAPSTPPPPSDRIGLML